jgi:RNA polymerase-binding transcription factor DksA
MVSGHCSSSGKKLKKGTKRLKAKAGKTLTVECKNEKHSYKGKGNYVDKGQPRKGGKWHKARRSGRHKKK